MSGRRRGVRVAGMAAAAAAAASVFVVAPIATAPPAEAFFGLEDLLDPTLWAPPAGWDIPIDQLFDPAALGLTDLAAAAPAGWADPGLAATALDDLFAQTSRWVDDVLAALTYPGGDALPLSAVAAPAATESLTSASVPLDVVNGTEPLVVISSGGGPEVPVVVDTGSAGLVLPWWDLGPQNIAIPTDFGISGYSGGIDYFYITLPTTVNFGPDIVTGTDVVTGPTSVNAVLLTWPTTLSCLPGCLSWQGFMNGTGADGVLGVGPNAVGPAPDAIPTAALPGALGHGLLIDQGNQVLTFGDNPLPAGSPSVTGAPAGDLLVQIGAGTPQPVTGALIDSGGVYGTMPASVGAPAVNGVVAPGTLITVYNSSGDQLYQYTTTAENAPAVISSGAMNTGNIPFALHPVYISYSPDGVGTTTFGN